MHLCIALSSVQATADRQAHICIAGCGFLDTATQLVKLGADVNARDLTQCTPLQNAAHGTYSALATMPLNGTQNAVTGQSCCTQVSSDNVLHHMLYRLCCVPLLCHERDIMLCKALWCHRRLCCVPLLYHQRCI